MSRPSGVEEWGRERIHGATGRLRDERRHPRHEDDDWPLGFEGTVLTPHGIVEVHALWLHTRPLHIRRFRQHLIFTAVVDGRQVWGRLERPASRALTKRGATTIAHRWMKELHEEGPG